MKTKNKFTNKIQALRYKIRKNKGKNKKKQTRLPQNTAKKPKSVWRNKRTKEL